MKKRVLGTLAAFFALAALLLAGANAAENAYAILYEDGELVFQYGDAVEPGRRVKATYELDLTAEYLWDNETRSPTTPWAGELESVRFVSFADKIRPASTAWWFDSCMNLERVDGISNLDTANVTNMDGMFAFCRNLTALDLSRLDTSRVTSMEILFRGCEKLEELDVSAFDTADVTDMFAVFDGCAALRELDLSSFDTAKVEYMDDMFSNCPNLQTVYASEKFTLASVTDSWGMFINCASLVGGAGTGYDENHTDAEYARIDAPGTPGYFTAKDAAPAAYAIIGVAEENGKAYVTLRNPGAVTVAISYFDAGGKFVSAEWQSVGANAGTVALDIPAGAGAARLMLLDGERRPLFAVGA